MKQGWLFGLLDYLKRLLANGYSLKELRRVSRIYREKPKGKPRLDALRAANRTKSKIRARVEHVFAKQKAHIVLVICTIGIKRAEIKIILQANR
jgi:IS5 family transposase